MDKNPELYRKDLEIGNLYYLYEKLKRKERFSDSVVVWKIGPSLNPAEGEKDIFVDTLWMNSHNPFVVLEMEMDTEMSTTCWYKVLTKNAKIGWFALDEEDMHLLHICFKMAEVPED